MLSRELVMKVSLMRLWAHGQLAPQFAARQRAYLALVQAILHDGTSATRAHSLRTGKRGRAIRRAV